MAGLDGREVDCNGGVADEDLAAHATERQRNPRFGLAPGQGSRSSWQPFNDPELKANYTPYAPANPSPTIYGPATSEVNAHNHMESSPWQASGDFQFSLPNQQQRPAVDPNQLPDSSFFQQPQHPRFPASKKHPPPGFHSQHRPHSQHDANFLPGMHVGGGNVEPTRVDVNNLYTQDPGDRQSANEQWQDQVHAMSACQFGSSTNELRAANAPVAINSRWNRADPMTKQHDGGRQGNVPGPRHAQNHQQQPPVQWTPAPSHTRDHIAQPVKAASPVPSEEEAPKIKDDINAPKILPRVPVTSVAHDGEAHLQQMPPHVSSNTNTKASPEVSRLDTSTPQADQGEIDVTGQHEKRPGNRGATLRFPKDDLHFNEVAKSAVVQKRQPSASVGSNADSSERQSRASSVSSDSSDLLDIAQRATSSSKKKAKKQRKLRKTDHKAGGGVLTPPRTLSQSVDRKQNSSKKTKDLPQRVPETHGSPLRSSSTSESFQAAGGATWTSILSPSTLASLSKNSTVLLFNATRIFEAAMSIFGVGLAMILALFIQALQSVHKCNRAGFDLFFTHKHSCMCYLFLYTFPMTVDLLFSWAPPYVQVCLWYSFLVQCFWPSITERKRGISMSMYILPLGFLYEGVSHSSFVLRLSGGERLALAFAMSAAYDWSSKKLIFLTTLSVEILMASFLQDVWFAQYVQFVVGVFCLRLLLGLGQKEEDGVDLANLGAIRMPSYVSKGKGRAAAATKLSSNTKM